MVQIDRRGTARCLCENFKKFSKITEFEFQNSGPPFFASVSPVYYKKNLDSIGTKLTEEIDFEVCPYGDSSVCHFGNLPHYWPRGGRRAAEVDDRCADLEMLRPHYAAVPNWGRSELGAH